MLCCYERKLKFVFLIRMQPTRFTRWYAFHSSQRVASLGFHILVLLVSLVTGKLLGMWLQILMVLKFFCE